MSAFWSLWRADRVIRVGISPRGQDGRPVPMFDRYTAALTLPSSPTGTIITTWQTLFRKRGPSAALSCGAGFTSLSAQQTRSTFDQAAQKMEAVLKALNADLRLLQLLPDRTHFDLYTTYPMGGPKGDRLGLFTQIGAEGYAVARPHANWKPAE